MKNFFVAKNFRAINFCSPKCLCFEENFIIYSTQRRGKYSQKLIQGLSLLGKELPTLTCRLLSTFVVTMTTFWPLYPPGLHQVVVYQDNIQRISNWALYLIYCSCLGIFRIILIWYFIYCSPQGLNSQLVSSTLTNQLFNPLVPNPWGS